MLIQDFKTRISDILIGVHTLNALHLSDPSPNAPHKQLKSTWAVLWDELLIWLALIVPF